MNPQLAAFLSFLRRFPFASLCVVVTIVFGVGAWFLSQDVDEQEQARQDRAKEGEAMLELLVGGTAQRQELAIAQEAARRIDENLVLEKETVENNWYFFKLEEQTKARLVENRSQSAAGNDNSTLFKRIPWTLRVNGTYEQITSFLLALETGPRLVAVTAFSISRNAAGAGSATDSGTLSMELNIEMLGKK